MIYTNCKTYDEYVEALKSHIVTHNVPYTKGIIKAFENNDEIVFYVFFSKKALYLRYINGEFKYTTFNNSDVKLDFDMIKRLYVDAINLNVIINPFKLDKDIVVYEPFTYTEQEMKYVENDIECTKSLLNSVHRIIESHRLYRKLTSVYCEKNKMTDGYTVTLGLNPCDGMGTVCSTITVTNVDKYIMRGTFGILLTDDVLEQVLNDEAHSEILIAFIFYNMDRIFKEWGFDI